MVNLTRKLVISFRGISTYEICGQTSDDSLFTNNTFAMQQAYMEVSCTTPEVGTQQISDIIIPGYQKEDGLLERLYTEYERITSKTLNRW